MELQKRIPSILWQTVEKQAEGIGGFMAPTEVTSQHKQGCSLRGLNRADSHGNATMATGLYLEVKITSNLFQNWQKKFFKKEVLQLLTWRNSYTSVPVLISQLPGKFLDSYYVLDTAPGTEDTAKNEARFLPSFVLLV